MIKFIHPTEVLPLRSLVLRNGKAFNQCVFNGDTDFNTFHLGYIVNGQIKCIASFMPTSNLPTEDKVWQLRGMATHPDFSGKGYGKALVNFSIDHAKQKNIDYLWCNARASAVPFYQKLGFLIDSEEFQIPDIGSHFKMKLNLK
ncbi:GNAT family N-acetyltransferase [Pedobacter changchengzhani]|uniref:GNAT family N-acetyltransferase n=1 Tax=Pedobacter changchengzhani TaxID=2529274 RepID=A0A4R5MHW0_9SPHI|nr:GNAT family N-acetyltransferase [Pedobacter changchengzhani]TDG35150.1 GNAT family N-acetyltransferase [Pedobacter changchengzhani]